MGVWSWFHKLCAVLLVCGMSSVAQAGPVETLGDAQIHPTDADVITLFYENAGGGMIHTTDGGEHWGLVCNSALGASREAVSSVISASGEIYLGFFSAMLKDDGGRCSFDQVPAFDGQWMTDVTLHPDDPSVVLTITSGGGKLNGIWKRTGDAEFELVGNQEQVLISRVRVTTLPGGGERYYETIARGETMEMVDGLPVFFPNYFVRSSEDDAMTWTEHAFPKTEGTLRLELIDPQDPNRVVVSIDNTREGETDFVLVSDDAGANFHQVAELQQLGGLALDADGRLWVGDLETGLFVGALTDDALSLENDEVRPTCVRFDPLSGKLYVCEKFGFGTYDEDAKSFTQLFDITQTEAFLDCSAVRDQVDECEEQMFAGYCGPSHFPGAQICWENYPEKVPHPDAGGSTGGSGGSGGSSGTPGTDAGMEPQPDAGMEDSGSDGGCGCTVPGSRAPRHAGHASWLLLPVALWLRRPRRRPS